jgi:hypothetical protein
MTATVRSITQDGRFEPFELQVSRGVIYGHTPIQIFGFSNSVGSTAQGPLWEGLTPSGGLYTYPSSASQLTLVSSSASDTSALSVQIQGLDANFNILNETIAMNGTTPVTTVGSFLRINGMITTNGSNVGTITAKIDSTLYAQINAGIGSTQMSIYTVPAGYDFYLYYVQGDANIGFTSSSYLTFQEYNKDNISGHVNVLNQSTFVQAFQFPFACPVKHLEKTDLQFEVKASTGTNTIANIYAGGILIQKDILTNTTP